MAMLNDVVWRWLHLVDMAWIPMVRPAGGEKKEVVPCLGRSVFEMSHTNLADIKTRSEVK